MVPRALRPQGVREHDLYNVMMLGDVYERADEFELIHSHVDWLAFPFTRFTDTPTVHTLHGRLDLPILRDVYRHYPELHLVSISDAQRRPLSGVRFEATVHHGLPRDLLSFHPKHADYFLFLARTSPEKGPVLAIEAARRAGVTLKIAAKIDPTDAEFWEREIEPRLDPPQIEYVGEVNDREKDELLGNARALLLPIIWPEPFGLTFIEALACGTPVITRPCGSIPEIIRPGVTGFLASTLDELVAAIRDVDRIDRATCRAEFDARFVVERMTDDYESVYKKLFERPSVRRASREVPRVG
jgi:glycosyltransferase involved in cell wall biosynthesis